MNAAAKRAAREKQAAEDGVFALRLFAACALLATTMWIFLPSCEDRRGIAAAKPTPLSWLSRLLWGQEEELSLEGVQGRVPRLIHQVLPPGGAAAVPEQLLPLQVRVCLAQL